MSNSLSIRHPRAGGNPAGLFTMTFEFDLAAQDTYLFDWIPACAGMTGRGVL